MPNITGVKKRLAASFPDVVFTYGTAGRGRMRGRFVAWHGGPDAVQVRVAARGGTSGNVQYHFTRLPTAAEADALMAQYEAERPAREAAQEAARIARRDAGKAKAAATRARNTATRKALAAWSDTVFTLDSHGRPHWVGGPSVEDVAAAVKMPLGDWCREYFRPCWAAVTPPTETDKTPAVRLARRLAASKARALAVARGIARRAEVAAALAERHHLPLFEWAGVDTTQQGMRA